MYIHVSVYISYVYFYTHSVLIYTYTYHFYTYPHNEATPPNFSQVTRFGSRFLVHSFGLDLAVFFHGCFKLLWPHQAEVNEENLNLQSPPK